MKRILAAFVTVGLSATAGTAIDLGSPPLETIESLYPGKAYSPYAKRSFPDAVYWGDSHVHTGLPIKLGRPLDWIVLADHTDLMGFALDLQNGKPNVLANEKGLEWYEGYLQGGEVAGRAAFDLITKFSQMTLPEMFLNAYSSGAPIDDGVWERIVDVAEDASKPGRFTAFIGFEWTSVPKGFNLYRNVMLRDGGASALQVSPPTTQPPVGNTDPFHLWKWLEEYEERTGGTAMAFAHNGNLSNGWMFPTDDTCHGGKVDDEYVRLRAKWEPHYENTQIKGEGEAHPYLSPEDEFADYENGDVGNLDITELKTSEMLGGKYAREALKRGLQLEAEFGVNPYKFGLGAATDTHTALPTAEEDNFFGKSSSVEPSATRINHPFIANELGRIEGNTGVWAEENTRCSIFGAIKRKETYGTTGPRMTVRFFGGWDFNDDDLRSRTPAFVGYEKGVPIGGDMRPASSDAPNFMVYALHDPVGANLDRVQIVKGWSEPDGSLTEKVYDVAWSDGREPGADGKLPPVGNTVDIEAASWTNTIGASGLAAIWTDPDFDPTSVLSVMPASWKYRPHAGCSTTRSGLVPKFHPKRN